MQLAKRTRRGFRKSHERTHSGKHINKYRIIIPPYDFLAKMTVASHALSQTEGLRKKREATTSNEISSKKELFIPCLAV